MKIAQVAPLWIPVPPYTYGGTEFVVSLLTEELVKRGHEVTLFASGDSRTSAELVSIWPKSLWRAKLSTPHAAFGLLYNELLKRKNDFDIIHDHCEFYTAPFSQFFDCPIVSTLHHPIYEEMIILFKKNPKINYIAISKNQKRTAPGINIVKAIYHGLPVEKYVFNSQSKNYLLWLSKITPQKGPLDAIEVAKKSGEKLILAGIIPKEYEDYFEYRLQPLIDGEQIKFVGAANFQKKVELFSNAKVLLYPIRRAEPFGLVVIESMACGAPVIAYKTGSMPELIEDGKTGFLVSNQEEMIDALKKVDQIKRADCRRHIVRKFNLKKMVNKYEALYYTLVKNQKKKNQNEKET